LACMEQSCPKR